MYRWPLLLLRGRSPVDGGTRCLVELSPRAAMLTLSTLANEGDPLDLVALDRVITGRTQRGSEPPAHEQERRLTSLAASVLAPLILGHEAGSAHVTLADVIRLPDGICGRDGKGGGAATYRFLFADGATCLWVATRAWTEDESAEPAPTYNGVGITIPHWITIDARLPACQAEPPPIGQEAPRVPTTSNETDGVRVRVVGLAAIAADNGRPDRIDAPDPPRADLRSVALGLWGRSSAVQRAALDGRSAYDPHATPRGTEPIADLGRDAADSMSVLLLACAAERRLAAGRIEHVGLRVPVTLTPEPDGGATLTLLPPIDAEPTPAMVERMEATSRKLVACLMSRPFAEERKEPIEHRLVGPDRTVALLVGWSLVLPRNRKVFAAWLGSDGRVMIRLFPPEGQAARGRL